MKKITKLQEKMSRICPYPKLWDETNCDETRKPVSELGYFRCDNDGYRWYNTVWPVHNNLYTAELGAEFDAVLDAFRRAFKDIPAMRKWCSANAEKTDDPTEYNAYFIGDKGFYWFRMITRRGDYNLYLHCFSKRAM
ncbi:MAG: hypothetical protein IKN04_11690 [Clostridia bacterium]|nr:hypothetical protein [Clostridia bacterium]